MNQSCHIRINNFQQLFYPSTFIPQCLIIQSIQLRMNPLTVIFTSEFVLQTIFEKWHLKYFPFSLTLAIKKQLTIFIWLETFEASQSIKNLVLLTIYHKLQIIRTCLFALKKEKNRSYDIINPVRIQNKKMQSSFSTDELRNLVGNYKINYSELLGKGTTGTVYRGYHNETYSPVAIKVIDLATIKDDATKSLLENEKLALQTVKNAHVVKLEDIVEQDGKCFIITELCDGETLREIILKRGKLSEEEAMSIFRKILIGCSAITQNCIIHRDLKPANILISKSLQPKIIDFGFCQVIRSNKVMRTFNVGSPSYMAPEAFLRTLYSQKSDCWSLGVILFEMLFGRTLDEGMVIKDFYNLIKSNPNYVSQFLGNLSESTRQIIEKSLKFLPEERTSISSIKYLADVFNLKRNKPASTSFTSSNGFGVSNHQNPSSRNQMAQTLHNISGATLNGSVKEGFISFADFCKPNPQHPRYNKISQISLSSSSNKNSSVQYFSNGGRTNENFQLIANKLNNYPAPDHQSLSSKQILQRRPKGPPAFRQVTVRYL